MISVIIPVYKVEPYLERCVDSVLKQTYSNIEIILVDDGSPDNCGSICDGYAAKDTRVKVIHKQNGGISSARNAGIEAAAGNYIAFVDSDDWVDVGFIERLRSTAVSVEADMSACVFCRTGDAPCERREFSDEITVITDSKYVCAMSEDSYAGYAWNKLFKADIIKNNGLRFDERISNGEDFLFTMEYLRYAKRVAFIRQDLYYYYSREGSMMRSIRLNDRYLSIICAREKGLEFAEKYAPECVGVCKYAYLIQLLKIKYLCAADKQKHLDIYNEMQTKIKENGKGILSLGGVSVKNKIKLILMLRFQRIFAKLYNKRVRMVE